MGGARIGGTEEVAESRWRQPWNGTGCASVRKDNYEISSKQYDIESVLMSYKTSEARNYILYNKMHDAHLTYICEKCQMPNHQQHSIKAG